jgi:hypothetical protein
MWKKNSIFDGQSAKVEPGMQRLKEEEVCEREEEKTSKVTRAGK